MIAGAVNPRLSAAALSQNSTFLMRRLTEDSAYSSAALIQKQKVLDKKFDRMHGVQDNIALECLQNIIIRRKIILEEKQSREENMVRIQPVNFRMNYTIEFVHTLVGITFT